MTDPVPLTDEELAALASYYGTEGTTEYDPEVLRLVAEVERLRVFPKVRVTVTGPLIPPWRLTR